MWLLCLAALGLSYPITYLLFYRNNWPSAIWFSKTRPKCYVLYSCSGWCDQPYLIEYWYTQPISYDEYLLRIYYSGGWVASRATLLEGRLLPFLTLDEIDAPSLIHYPLDFIYYCYYYLLAKLWLFYAQLAFVYPASNF